MSVIKAKRRESPVQFINTAMKICEHTFKYTAKKFQKRDVDIVRRLRNIAMDLLETTIEGNSIMAKNERELELRKNYFQKAYASCNALDTLLSIIHNIVPNEVTTFGWEEWGRLIDEEKRLLTGIINKDKVK